MIAAHAKLGFSIGGGREAFILPMKGTTGRTKCVKETKEVDRPCRVKWTACDWNQWKIEDDVKKLRKEYI